MPARHRRPPVFRRSRARRARLLVVAVAPVVVLAPLTAMAAGVGSSHTTHTRHTSSTSTPGAAQTAKTPAAKPNAAAPAAARVSWSKSWTPPLALLSDFTGKRSSSAGFAALSYSIVATGSQKLTLTAAVKTRWVDTKARADSPNILQEGLYGLSAQLKLQIRHGANPTDHRAQCRVKGTDGSVLATGPAIDVADGAWHTIRCTKSADVNSRTKVVVTVDGVAGTATYSTSAIGRVAPSGKLDLGGRSAVASSDSLDGWIRSVKLTIG